MYITPFIWLICLVTIGDSSKVLESSLSDQEVNLNEQLIHTFVNDVKRGGDGVTADDAEEKKLRLLGILKRMKFGNNIALLPECGNPTLLFSCYKYPQQFLDFMNKRQGDIRKLGSFPTSQIRELKYAGRGRTKNIGLHSSKLSAYAAQFNDYLWNDQFYVQDYRTEDGPVMDMNVVPVYKLGITGKGVRIAVIDSGIDVTHRDLQDNILKDLNHDYCYNKPESPVRKIKVYEDFFDDTHGTEIAGIIAMIANNGKGGVGIAYNAKIAGVRFSCDSLEIQNALYPPSGNDMVERRNQIVYTYFQIIANALNHRLDMFDIYQNSVGHFDSPKLMVPFHPLEDKALMDGISKGRNGKGAIYMFGVGNGKKEGDNCASDRFANHVATIGVAAVAEDGKPTSYSEQCTAVFTTAYGGSGLGSQQIVATLTQNRMTTFSFGTSAASAIVSGIVALALEAKPELTYRDVMHLIARSSEVAPLANNRYIWQKNAAGFWVSDDFGFGLLNAERMVTLAKGWTTAPEQLTCTIGFHPTSRTVLSLRDDAVMSFNTDKCYSLIRQGIYHLEQVVVTPYIKYPARGAISIYLTSPQGTTLTIMKGRSQDDSKEGFSGHSIKSVHYWGENPQGIWKLRITTSMMWRAVAGWSEPNELQKFKVTLYGTSHQPNIEPRTYDSFRLPNRLEQNN